MGLEDSIWAASSTGHQEPCNPSADDKIEQLPVTEPRHAAPRTSITSTSATNQDGLPVLYRPDATAGARAIHNEVTKSSNKGSTRGRLTYGDRSASTSPSYVSTTSSGLTVRATGNKAMAPRVSASSVSSASRQMKATQARPLIENTDTKVLLRQALDKTQKGNREREAKSTRDETEEAIHQKLKVRREEAERQHRAQLALEAEEKSEAKKQQAQDKNSFEQLAKERRQEGLDEKRLSEEAAERKRVKETKERQVAELESKAIEEEDLGSGMTTHTPNDTLSDAVTLREAIRVESERLQLAMVQSRANASTDVTLEEVARRVTAKLSQIDAHIKMVPTAAPFGSAVEAAELAATLVVLTEDKKVLEGMIEEIASKLKLVGEHFDITLQRAALWKREKELQAEIETQQT